MSPLTREDVVAAAGPIEDHLIVEIIASGATLEELGQALAWMANDEAPINAGDPLASGRVARLMEILEAADEGTLEETR